MMKLKSLTGFLASRALNFSFKGIFLAIFASRKSALKPVDVLFVCHDNSRTAIVNNLRFAPVTDTILDDLGPTYSTLTFALPFSKYFGKNCYGNVVMYNRSILLAYTKRLFSTYTLALKSIENDPLIKVWEKALDRVNPKVILGVNPSVELCIAARSRKIWVADVQHGILAYGNYYDLRKRSQFGQQGWPDEILCWDHFSKKFIDSNFQHFVQARVVGHPAYYSESSHRLLTKTVMAQTSADRANILITLDSLCPPSLNYDIVYNEVGMPQQLYEYIKGYGAAYNWHLRLHPAQLQTKKKQVYGFLEKYFKGMANVQWDECSIKPLPVVLEKISLHMTYNSAATREAAFYSIDSILFDTHVEAVHSYFGDLISSGSATMINPDDRNKISNWIKDRYTKKQNTLTSGEQGQRLRNEFADFIAFLKNKIKNQDIPS